MRDYIYIIILAIVLVIVFFVILHAVSKVKYKKSIKEITSKLGFNPLELKPYDDSVVLNSRQAIEKYTADKYFKDHKENLASSLNTMEENRNRYNAITDFIDSHKIGSAKAKKKIYGVVSVMKQHLDEYRVRIYYSSPKQQSIVDRIMFIPREFIDKCMEDPSLYMSRSDLKNYLNDALENKKKEYYDRINKIIDSVNDRKGKFAISNNEPVLDNLIHKLFAGTLKVIPKIRSVDSQDWDELDKFISGIEVDVNYIIQEDDEIIQYYESSEFAEIKSTVEGLMSSQKEFNEYIEEKVQSIFSLFGTRIVRNETEVEDLYNYVRPYKKTLKPFVAEVSDAVFSSAENSPLEYVVKYFYPDKNAYPDQIQKLKYLIEELETLKDAKQIIDNYKKDYAEYIENVPPFIMEKDEAGFYARLGFARIDEKSLTVEYVFTYTSNGGKAQRSFSVPMTEETVISLVERLESKLTFSAFAKEQRALMTTKLRRAILDRDNYTCRICGNSVHNEPNLLLEVDHIIPVAKGGVTVEDNLQALCWRCNRSKGSKVQV